MPWGWVVSKHAIGLICMCCIFSVWCVCGCVLASVGYEGRCSSIVHTFCDTLASPVRGHGAAHCCAMGPRFEITMVVARQAPHHACIISHWWCSGNGCATHARWRRSAPAASRLVYPSRLVCQVCQTPALWDLCLPKCSQVAD